MAFFPCIYFCENNQLYFTGKHYNLRKLSAIDKSNIIIDRANKREQFYSLCLKLFTICETKGLRLIVENPYSIMHYLIDNFPYKPSVIDKNRTLRGDYYKKPTQYFFVSCVPTDGLTIQKDKVTKIVEYSKSSSKAGLCSEERSMISPDYARNFICDFILGKTQNGSQLSLF